MCQYVTLGPVSLPAYGCLIALGVVLANLAAVPVLRKAHLDFNDLLILEAYGLLGGFVGAKLLYLLLSAGNIDWSRITDPAGFSSLMNSGFVFYGGLIGGLAMVAAAGRLHGLPAGTYLRRLVFLVPLVHGFGRLGCFCVGCCYGIPWEGPGAVIFPEGSPAPAGVPLFPVQLVEAGLLFLLSLLLFLLRFCRQRQDTLEVYLLLYGLIRFVLEFFRNDAVRGSFAGLSTSQWISLGLVAAALLLRRRHRTGTGPGVNTE